MTRSLVLVLVLTGLAACRPSADRVDAAESGAEAAGGQVTPSRGGDPVARGAERATAETLPANAVLASSGAEPEMTGANAVAPPASAVQANNSVTAVAAPAPTIPAEYRGRWGLVPADCTSTRGDAKGLITVSDRTVRFYEATATVKEQLPSSAGGFTAAFSHTGEGQSWETVTSFARQGDTLTRTEGQQGFTYTRCR